MSAARPAREGTGGGPDGPGRCPSRQGLRPLNWHALRHSFASHLVMRGVSLVAVQQLLGHHSVTETMRYAHLSEGHLHEAIGRLGPPKS